MNSQALEEGRSASHDRQRIVSALYEMLSNPTGYEGLVASLGAGYGRALGSADLPQDKDAVELVRAYLDGVEPHFQLVADVFARFRLEVGTQSAPTRSAEDHAPKLELGVTGEILRANAGARRLLGVAAGDTVASLPLDAGDHHLLKRALRELGRDRGGARYTFLQAYSGVDGGRIMLLLSRGETADGRACGVITVVDLDWRSDIGDALSRTFDLTPAEEDILRSIVAGGSLADLAEAKGRSLATVRTQAKSLLRKTEAKSQLELVRIFAAMCLALPGGLEAPHAGANAGRRSFMVERERHRTLQVDVFGPEDGTPVILVHGFVTGTAMTGAMIEALHAHKIKVIAPWRPAFAGSTPCDATPAAYPDLVCDDIRFVMGRFGVDRTVLVARDSGVIYAGAAAKRLDARVSAVIAVAGTVPTRCRKQLDHIALWQRMFAYSARYLPIALPVLARGAMEMVANGKLDRLLEGLYAAPPIDAAWARKPAIREALRESFESTFVQGTRGYEIDARQTALDWTEQSLTGLAAPVLYLHGRLDPTSVLWQVEDLANLQGSVRVEAVDDGGQLIWYSHPQRVVDAIIRHLPKAAARGR
jgi:pimeloyl-ACP methyl ester carboxylesterase/DNA-binding CsgD family transcriptional regulator